MYISKKSLIFGTLALALVAAWIFLQSPQTPSTTEVALPKETAASANAVVSTKTNHSSSSQIKKDEGSNESFEALTKRVLESIPTKAALRQLSPEETHHTPALIMEAADKLGDVAEALDFKLKHAEGNSSAKEKALQEGIYFYHQCLDKKESPDSIRALCYTHYRELREKSGAPETPEEAQSIPSKIRSLADFVSNH